MIRAVAIAVLVSQASTHHASRLEKCIDQEIDEWRLGEEDAGLSLIPVDHAYLTTPDGGVTLVTSGAWASDDQLMTNARELAERRAKDTKLEEAAAMHAVSFWIPAGILASGIVIGTVIGYAAARK